MLFFIKEMSEIPVVPAEAGTHAEVAKDAQYGFPPSRTTVRGKSERVTAEVSSVEVAGNVFGVYMRTSRVSRLEPKPATYDYDNHFPGGLKGAAA
jgi:hypothetical protein